MDGKGIPKDEARALVLYEQASSDLPRAAYSLGMAHAHGKGTPKGARDETLARKWLAKAADAHYTHALLELGTRFVFRRLVEASLIPAGTRKATCTTACTW